MVVMYQDYTHCLAGMNVSSLLTVHLELPMFTVAILGRWGIRFNPLISTVVPPSLGPLFGENYRVINSRFCS